MKKLVLQTRTGRHITAKVYLGPGAQLDDDDVLGRIEEVTRALAAESDRQERVLRDRLHEWHAILRWLRDRAPSQARYADRAGGLYEDPYDDDTAAATAARLVEDMARVGILAIQSQLQILARARAHVLAPIVFDMRPSTTLNLADCPAGRPSAAQHARAIEDIEFLRGQLGYLPRFQLEWRFGVPGLPRGETSQYADGSIVVRISDCVAPEDLRGLLAHELAHVVTLAAAGPEKTSYTGEEIEQMERHAAEFAAHVRPST
jgi:hypothetical protein